MENIGQNPADNKWEYEKPVIIEKKEIRIELQTNELPAEPPPPLGMP